VEPPRVTRRQLGYGLALAALCRAGPASASAVPARLQADLLHRLAPYDRGLRDRAGPLVSILLARKAGDPSSEREVGDVAAALGTYDRIGGLPHREEIVASSAPVELAARCRSSRIAIAYLAPDVVTDPVAVRAAFDGVNVLTVAPSAELAVSGAVVLAIDLVSSKPKLTFNLTTAQRQGITMASEVLKLMTVIR
jgi:hypothetical protein